MRYYLDTSIWIDYFEKRGVNGEYAIKLLLNIIREDTIILFSDLHVREFKHLGYGSGQVNILLKIAKPDKIGRVHISREQIAEARRLGSQRNVPFGDALHAILARDNEAVLVSRDGDFQKLRDVCETKKPEEFQ